MTGNDAMPEFVVDLFVDKDEAEHGSAQAPLIVALLKQHQLKQGGQQLRQQLRPLLHMGSYCLHKQAQKYCFSS